MDMQDRIAVKRHQDKVSRIIEKRQHEWGWSCVDVARALMHVLPGAKPERSVRKAPAERDQSFFWDDIPSIAAALQAHEMTKVVDANAVVIQESKTDALFQALAVVNQRGEEKPAHKSTSARVVCVIVSLCLCL